jgi:biotin operon repressor
MWQKFFNLAFFSMNLEKLFGSKTKVDILKYLLFRRQGISMRALESELERTFPAIKKQVDSLEESGILSIEKDSAGFAISMHPQQYDIFRQFFFYAMKIQLTQLFESYAIMISKYFRGKKFGVPLEMDLIIVYQYMEKPQIEELKAAIADIFRDFFIENVSLVFMSAEEWERRYRMADKFVLQVMRYFPEAK